MVLNFRFPEPYDLRQTFECGQIFRFSSDDGGTTYYGSYGDRVLKLVQIDAKCIEVSSNVSKGLQQVADRFLRTDIKYGEMLEALRRDPVMAEILEETIGLRLLLQDPLECMVSYFLSQCSNIPRIKQNLHTIVTQLGETIKFEGKKFWIFPPRERWDAITEETLRDWGFGYRAKYIAPFIHNYPAFLDKPIEDWEIFNKVLQDIYGIGAKVADCVQLFAFGDLGRFPVDTWIHKFVQARYFGGQKITPRKARIFGMEQFGPWAGYAQEFIYMWARNHL